MAKDVILGKIRREIERGVVDECQVVFVLSRIRKLLEDSDLLESYGYLNFYCNWALHSKIDRTKRLKSVLEDVKCLQKTENGAFFFKEFGGELHRFCKKYDIECKWVTSSEDWRRLASLLTEIYTEVPLIYREEIPRGHVLGLESHSKSNSKLFLEEQIELKNIGSGLKVIVSPLMIKSKAHKGNRNLSTGK